MSQTKAKQAPLVLAFDIERSGPTSEYQTFAIGASVVDADFNEIDSFLVCNYRPGQTRFEHYCWHDFWSKHQNILQKMAISTTETIEEVEDQMIRQFQDFRRKWEAQGCVTVCDNIAFDARFLSEMIEKYTSDRPMPYTACFKMDKKTGFQQHKYGVLFETTSMQKGFLMSAIPTYDKDWGFGKLINSRFAVYDSKVSHDHLPNNDAYLIARDFQIMRAIQDGRLHLHGPPAPIYTK